MLWFRGQPNRNAFKCRGRRKHVVTFWPQVYRVTDVHLNCFHLKSFMAAEALANERISLVR